MTVVGPSPAVLVSWLGQISIVSESSTRHSMVCLSVNIAQGGICSNLYIGTSEALADRLIGIGYDTGQRENGTMGG